jgi:hypothetical protein
MRVIQKVIILLFALTGSACAHAPAEDEMQSIGGKLDSQFFSAYNTCNLSALADLIAPDVEFYHDKGGMMLGRQLIVDTIRKNICGKVRRELIPETLESYPMDNYGIVQFGEHRFCAVDTGKCTGVAKFVILWRQVDGTWQATRIISYDHQPLQ